MSSLRLNPLFRDLQWHRLSALWGELHPYLTPVKREMILAVLCSVGGVGMAIARPWPIKMVLDYALLPDGRVKWVFPYHLLKGYGAMGVASIACVLLLAISLLWGLSVSYTHLRAHET